MLLDANIQLSVEVSEQGPITEAIDKHVENVQTDVGRGNTELASGVVKARARLRKKWWCLGICGQYIHVLDSSATYLIHSPHSRYRRPRLRPLLYCWTWEAPIGVCAIHTLSIQALRLDRHFWVDWRISLSKYRKHPLIGVCQYPKTGRTGAKRGEMLVNSYCNT